MELRNFFKKKQIKNSAQNNRDFEKKNNKFLKVFGCLALATFMTATALFATAPFGMSAASAAVNSNLSNNTQATSPLGLDPENDPVVYTTAAGIDIKFGGTAGWVESGGLTGYAYVTMGSFAASATSERVPVNWVIIGYNSSLGYLFGENVIVGGNELIKDTLDDSIAGQKILQHNSYSLYGVENDQELKTNEVLVISENFLGTSQFCVYDSGGYLSYDYNHSTNQLRPYMQELYDTKLALTDDEKSLIQPQTLTQYNYTNNSSTTKNAYIFPLAGREENFSYTTYLNSSDLRKMNVLYATRSGRNHYGGGVAYIDQNGNLQASSSSNNAYSETSRYNVRPACVLNLRGLM